MKIMKKLSLFFRRQHNEKRLARKRIKWNPDKIIAQTHVKDKMYGAARVMYFPRRTSIYPRVLYNRYVAILVVILLLLFSISHGYEVRNNTTKIRVIRSAGPFTKPFVHEKKNLLDFDKSFDRTGRQLKCPVRAIVELGFRRQSRLYTFVGLKTGDAERVSRALRFIVKYYSKLLRVTCNSLF